MPRARYRALCDGVHAEGPRGSVVLAVSTLDLDEGRDDVVAAAGLGLALVELGHGVRLVDREHWHLVERADVLVAMLPDVDPSYAPTGAWLVAWVRGESDGWVAGGHLPAYDQVIASSEPARSRLARETPRALGVVPVAAAEQAPAPGEQVRRDHAWTRSAASFAEQVEEARRTPDRREPAATRAVHFFPRYQQNPYQRMLYGRLDEAGAYAAPVDDLHRFFRLQHETPARRPGILHVHWTSPILQWAAGPFRAAIVLERFAEELARYREGGGRLVWTVHNVLPHDSRHVWAEIQLARLLARHADLIHVMSDGTPELVRDYYELDPARVVVVPHSSYLGQYPDRVTRDAARGALGLHPQERVLIALGGIRPYKGLGTLLDVFDELLDDDPTLRLLVAGHPAPGGEVEKFMDRCREHPRVLGEFRHLPDDRLQVWLRSADLAVLPYRQILNSGAFRLAETFGLPIVGPRAGALSGAEQDLHVRLFEPGDPRSLRDEVAGALRDLVADQAGAGRARASATAAAERFTPDDMSRALTEALAPLLAD